MGKKILDSKLLYALLAIVIAVALWFYVAAVENNTDDITIKDVPITFVNEEVLEERGMIISNGYNQEATLKLTGPMIELAKLDQEKEKIRLTIDVGKITSPGEQTMAFDLDLPSVYESSVTIQDWTPKNITFTVSRHIRKEIKVEGKFTGKLAEGYMRDEFVIRPGKIEISGIESEVNRVSHALVTLGGEKEFDATFRGEMGFDLIDFQGNVLSDVKITCPVESVSVELPIIKTADVPLAVKWITGGGVTDVEKYVDYTITPSIITVSGAEEDLEPLKEILLGEINLSTVIGRQIFEFDIPLASELNNLSGTTRAKVEVRVHGLSNKIMEVDNILLENIPEGFTAESVTKTLQVLVRGPMENLDLILPINLRVVADLSKIDAVVGRYTVPVKVYLDGTSDVGVVNNDYKIVVDLAEVEEAAEVVEE